jgi:hypothetical protein
MFDSAFYTFIIMTAVICVLFVMDFGVFVYKRCHKTEDEEEETSDQE